MARTIFSVQERDEQTDRPNTQHFLVFQAACEVGAAAVKLCIAIEDFCTFVAFTLNQNMVKNWSKMFSRLCTIDISRDKLPAQRKAAVVDRVVRYEVDKERCSG